MNTKKTASAILAGALSLALLSGCAEASNTAATAGSAAAASADVAVSASVASAAASASVGSVDVSFDGDDESFDWRSGGYTTLDISAGTQTVTESGVYEVTGTAASGSLVVDVDKSSDDGTVFLVLNNTSITSADSAPIYVKDAEKVVLLLEDGTTNTVSQGSGVVENSDGEPNAAIFSKADLTITGSGTLKVTSDYNDGVTSKDTLKITGGTLIVTAVKDGLVGKDALAVRDGSVTVTAGKDGLKATNDTDADQGNILLEDGTYTVRAEGDAIQAVGVLQIVGGTFNLTSGGGYSGVISTGGDFGPGMQGGRDWQTGPAGQSGQVWQQGFAQTASETSAGMEESDSKKALKADGGILITGGTFGISSYEDAIHSNGSVAINGGELIINAGDDSIHADAAVSIGGGVLTIENSYEGIEGTGIAVNGGDISVTSSDDGFNVNDRAGVLTFSGGKLTVNAGGDGLDSNGSILMTGGTVTVYGPTNDGNGALDYDGTFTINGGTLAAAGSSGMAQTGSPDSAQPSLLMTFSTAQAAGTAITLKDESGSTVAAFTPSKQYTSVAISTPDLTAGRTYTLWSGDTQVVSFTITDTVTFLNESGVTNGQGMMGSVQMGGGQFGGPMGGKPQGGGVS